MGSLGAIPSGPLRVYLIAFNSHTLKRNQLTNYLDSSPLFVNWITILPGQVFAASPYMPHEIASTLRGVFDKQFIFVTEVNPMSCDGLLPEEIWNFINHPTYAKTIF